MATIDAVRGDNGQIYLTVQSGADGQYSLALPYFDYELRVRATHHMPETRDVVVEEPNSTEDFYLAPTVGNLLLVNDTGGARGDDPKGPVASLPAGSRAARPCSTTVCWRSATTSLR